MRACVQVESNSHCKTMVRTGLKWIQTRSVNAHCSMRFELQYLNINFKRFHKSVGNMKCCELLDDIPL